MLTDRFLRCREAAVTAVGGADEGGQGMTEYALILVLIAVLVILVLTVLGKRTQNLYSNVGSGLGQ